MESASKGSSASAPTRSGLWIPPDTKSTALVGQSTIYDLFTTIFTNICYSRTCAGSMDLSCFVCFVKAVATFPSYKYVTFPQRALVAFLYPCSPLYPCCNSRCNPSSLFRLTGKSQRPNRQTNHNLNSHSRDQRNIDQHERPSTPDLIATTTTFKINKLPTSDT